MLVFISMVASFCLLHFLGRILAGKILFSRVAYRQSGEGEGSYPAGGVGYPRLARLCLLAARDPREFARGLDQDILSAFSMKFCKKMGSFFGGSTPAVAPEGDLVFGAESRVALDFIRSKKLHLYN
jgi:hypothetical protein